MQIHEKLKAIRQLKGLTQEELAEKINLAVNSYGKFERGEADADIKWKKLCKIAELLEVDIQDLIDTKERSIMNLAEHCCNNNISQHGVILLTETQCAHELEKAQLIIQQKDFILAQKDKEIRRLEEIIGLLKGSIGK